MEWGAFDSPQHLPMSPALSDECPLSHLGRLIELGPYEQPHSYDKILLGTGSLLGQNLTQNVFCHFPIPYRQVSCCGIGSCS